MAVARALDTIVLFGDSITQAGFNEGCFAQQLSVAYIRRMDVINRGFGGYTSEWAIPIFKQIFAKKDANQNLPKCKLLTIWFGANDASLPHRKQYVPLERYKNNLKWLIQAIRSPDSEYYAPWTRIILITAPAIDESVRTADFARRTPPEPAPLTAANTLLYVEAARDVAATEKVPLVDAWSLISNAAEKTEGGLRALLSDGLHLTRDGYQVIFDELIKTIAASYPELHYENLPFVFPSWEVVDRDDPEPTLKSQYTDI